MSTHNYGMFVPRSSEERKSREKAAAEIDEILYDFCSKLADIKTRYPHLGLGDTVSDEEIVEIIYSKIHK